MVERLGEMRNLIDEIEKGSREWIEIIGVASGTAGPVLAAPLFGP